MQHLRYMWVGLGVVLCAGMLWAQDDEFVAWEAGTSTPPVACATCPASAGHCAGIGSVNAAIMIMAAATIIAGILVRYKAGRRIRAVVLLLSVGAYGFMWGGCPCPLQGFQQLALVDSWHSVLSPVTLWLGGMILLAWLLGPTWCGWVCHLGALQELLFRANRKPAAPSERARRFLLWLRRAVLLAFLVSLVAVGTAWWEEVDPFRAVFNLKMASLAAVVSALTLAMISLFVYRPFCRALCPVGLVLGCINRLPRAMGPIYKAECRDCPQCNDVCRMGAIDGSGFINRELCIACGDCLDGCARGGIGWGRKTQKGNPS